MVRRNAGGGISSISTRTPPAWACKRGIFRVQHPCVLMSEADAADELGGTDARDEGGEVAAEEAAEKLPFAFTLCKDVIRKRAFVRLHTR